MSNTYNDDISIDEYNLDREWEMQASLYTKWANAHADAIAEKDKVKLRLELLYAKIDKKVRSDPERHGIDDRVTETAVKSAILSKIKYKNMSLKYVDAVRLVNRMQAAKEGMHHKRKALESLTQLFLAGYYAPRRMPDAAKRKSDADLERAVSDNLKNSNRINKKRK